VLAAAEDELRAGVEVLGAAEELLGAAEELLEILEVENVELEVVVETTEGT